MDDELIDRQVRADRQADRQTNRRKGGLRRSKQSFRETRGALCFSAWYRLYRAHVLVCAQQLSLVLAGAGWQVALLAPPARQLPGAAIGQPCVNIARLQRPARLLWRRLR
jgi:hypothetical protein